MMKLKQMSYALIGGLAVHVGTTVLAFESTKVLPAGVRNFNLKSIRTDVSQTIDNNAQYSTLGAPLEKEYKLGKVVKAEKDPAKQMMLRAFMKNNGLDEDTPLVRMQADVKSTVSVLAPIFSYGVSDAFTLAVAVPYWQAKIHREFGVQGSDEAQNVINLLGSEDYNQRGKAREMKNKLNDYVGELNKKLRENGFKNLEDWNGSGLGDITLAAKARFPTPTAVTLGNISGVTLPTGRVDDPDNLLDTNFGDGNYKAFTGLLVDEELMSGLFLNQYARFTYNFAAQRDIRLKTAEESIEIRKEKIRYKLGNMFETGASVQFEPDSGLVAGLGFVHTTKYSDVYYIEDNDDSKDELQRDSEENTNHWEAKLGYSSVPAFKRGEFKVPFSVGLEYRKHVVANRLGRFKSGNGKVKDLVTLDMSLFF